VKTENESLIQQRMAHKWQVHLFIQWLMILCVTGPFITWFWKNKRVFNNWGVLNLSLSIPQQTIKSMCCFYWPHSLSILQTLSFNCVPFSFPPNVQRSGHSVKTAAANNMLNAQISIPVYSFRFNLLHARLQCYYYKLL